MNPLSDFLSRFKRFAPPHDSLKKAVARAVGSVAGVSIQPSDVSVSNGVAFIRCSSVAKNAIRLSRGKIFEVLFKEEPKARETIRDLR